MLEKNANKTEYIGGLMKGTMSIIDEPGVMQLSRYTKTVYANTPYTKESETTSKGEVIEFTIEDKRYSMWLNQYKKPESKEPDYKIYPNDYKPKAETKMEYATPVNQQESEDDLPF